MACDNCGWDEAWMTAERVAHEQPEWKTRSTEFFLDVAETIKGKQHVTGRQLEVIQEGEQALEDG